MKTNNLKTINLSIINQETILSDYEASCIIGGNWIYRVAKTIAKAIRDGAIYDTVVEFGNRMIEADPQPTQQDLDRIEAGYTHIGGRQPWL